MLRLVASVSHRRIVFSNRIGGSSKHVSLSLLNRSSYIQPLSLMHSQLGGRRALSTQPDQQQQPQDAFLPSFPAPATEDHVMSSSTELLPLDQISAAVDPALSSLGFAPSDLVVRALTTIHEAGGLPWWASIVVMTVLVRSAILPLVVMSQKASANLVKASPDLELFKAEVSMNPPKTMEDQVKNSNRLQSIYAKHGVSMSAILLPIAVQMPLFITFFFGLQRLAQTYPSMQQGGMLWFTNLSAADPTYALPVLAAATFLVTVELGGEVPNPRMDGKMMKNIMRGLGVAMIPITMSFESGVLMYWVTTNSFTALQIATLKQPEVRKLLGLPAQAIVTPPPTSATMMKPPSFFEQLNRMTASTSASVSPPASKSSSSTSETKLNEQFVAEMKEARSRRGRRKN